MSQPLLLEVDRVTKTFPGVIANADVSLGVRTGAIHALLGENGAGKSTLVKMIYGVMRPDSGAMRLLGADYAPRSPAEARRRGIGMVFQHFSLFAGLTVAENIALGLDGAGVDRAIKERIVAVARSYGLALEPDRLVGTLSVGERQRVEIARCLIREPRLVIMDEPTSVLTPQEADALFATLRRVRDQGCSILYISHKLEEIRALCDTATVLRGGKVVASCDPREQSARSLAEMMIGANLKEPSRREATKGPVRLIVERLTMPSDHTFGVDLGDISFEVRAGEIVGIAGVAGNGQTELMEALIGERLAPQAAMIAVDGKAIGRVGPTGRREAGLAFVPEERLGHAAVPDMSLAENVVLSCSRGQAVVRHGLIDHGAARRQAEAVVDRFGVRTAGVGHAARSLSGGNLQKFVVGREVLQEPRVLIAAQPTWGVDAGAAAAIHQLIVDLAGRGTAVLLISQDLDELLAIANRIAVIANGRLTPPRPVGELTVEAIGIAMGGGAPREAAHA